MRKFAIAIVVIGAIGAAAYWWIFTSTGPDFADAEDSALVAQGQGIYAEHCASCHGVRLQGQPKWRQRRSDGRLPAPPHDQTGHTWHHDDTQLFQVTKFGTAAIAGPDYKTDMAGFSEALRDVEIWAVLAYIKSRWPQSVRQRHAEINKRQR